MNKDRDLVHSLLNGDRTPVPITSNPLARELSGSILRLDSAQGTATLAFEPPERFVQGVQILQGGIVATMLDFAVAFAVWTKLPAGKSFATATLTVSLLKPAAPGGYVATGKVVRIGSKVIFATADLTTQDSLVATASAVMAVLPGT